MKVRHTGTAELSDEIKDMEYLAHLLAVGQDVINQTVYTGEDWKAVHEAHDRFIAVLHAAYHRKWKLGREMRKS